MASVEISLLPPSPHTSSGSLTASASREMSTRACRTPRQELGWPGTPLSPEPRHGSSPFHNLCCPRMARLGKKMSQFGANSKAWFEYDIFGLWMLIQARRQFCKCWCNPFRSNNTENWLSLDSVTFKIMFRNKAELLWERSWKLHLSLSALW